MKGFVINNTYIDVGLASKFRFEWKKTRFNSGDPYNSYRFGWLFVREFLRKVEKDSHRQW